MKSKTIEVEHGEIRTICHGCSRVIPIRHLWCDSCKATKGKYCTRCGKPSGHQLCKDCRAKPPVVLGEDHRAEVEQMWGDGMNANEIATALGVRTRHANTLICNARKRGWDIPYRRIDAVENGKRQAARLNSKRKRKRRVTVKAIAKDPAIRQAAVERMWADGFTAMEISRVMGWSPRNPSANISKARVRGWRLPYRNPGVVSPATDQMMRINTARYGTDTNA